MKITEKETAGSGKTRLVFAINKDELELLHAIVCKAYLHTPKILETTFILNRLKDMKKELSKQISKIKPNFENRLFNSNKVSKIPCVACGGELIEFSIPNDIWNKVIRRKGKESDQEYLCIKCFFEKLRKELNLIAAD